MSIFGKPLNDVGIEEIHFLIENGTEESVILEFKKEPSSNTKETAKDISAMANSEGGIIIYGLDEDDAGKAKAINWLDSTNGIVERFENIIATTIHPSPQYKMFTIKNPKKDNASIFLLYIEKSLRLHMVIKGKDNRYYKRQGKSVHQMEHSEIMARLQNVIDTDKKEIEIITNLDNDYQKYSGLNLDNISIISYYIIPTLPLVGFDAENVKSVIDNMSGDKPIVGVTGISYKQSVSISNFHSTDKKFWERLLLMHHNGIIELRIHKDRYPSANEAMHMAGLLHWSKKLYSKLGYYGDLRLYSNIHHVSKFFYSKTMENMNGEYNFAGGKIIEKINVPSISILDEQTIKDIILKLSKKIGSYLSISGDGAYQDIKNTFQQNNLNVILNRIM
jgi:hypothetical protein